MCPGGDEGTLTHKRGRGKEGPKKEQEGQGGGGGENGPTAGGGGGRCTVKANASGGSRRAEPRDPPALLSSLPDRRQQGPKARRPGSNGRPGLPRWSKPASSDCLGRKRVAGRGRKSDMVWFMFQSRSVRTTDTVGAKTGQPGSTSTPAQ